MSSPRVVIVGAGFGGLAPAIELRRAGFDDIAILERGSGIGGTWRDNTYPGAACDVPSHLYSFSFHPGRWSERYSSQPDILAYLDDVVCTFGLEPHLRLSTEVTRCAFDDGRGTWDVTLASGE